MPTQDQTTIIALFSAATSFLAVGSSLFTTYWSKRVDAEQRQEDRQQDLRKIYVLRKLEVGESVIGRWTLLINKLKWFDYNYSKYGFDEQPEAEEYQELLAQERDINKSIDAANYTDKNPYYTYFKYDIEGAGGDAIANEHNDLRSQLITILDARATIVSMIGPEYASSSEAIKHSYQTKKEEYEKLLPRYLQANRSLRKYLMQCCTDLRNDLLKYDPQ